MVCVRDATMSLLDCHDDFIYICTITEAQPLCRISLNPVSSIMTISNDEGSCICLLTGAREIGMRRGMTQPQPGRHTWRTYVGGSTCQSVLRQSVMTSIGHPPTTSWSYITCLPLSIAQSRWTVCQPAASFHTFAVNRSR
jgi:hypothetical protein